MAMDIKQTTTQRGFEYITFNDQKGDQCSLQESSIASENCIWLGTDNANPQVLVEGEGWQPVEMQSDTLYNTRMHLNQQQVQTLLPILQHFADTGELPSTINGSDSQ